MGGSNEKSFGNAGRSAAVTGMQEYLIKNSHVFKGWDPFLLREGKCFNSSNTLCAALLFLQVLFSESAEGKIRRQAENEKDNRKREAAKMLENTIDLINQVRTPLAGLVLHLDSQPWAFRRHCQVSLCWIGCSRWGFDGFYFRCCLIIQDLSALCNMPNWKRWHLLNQLSFGMVGVKDLIFHGFHIFLKFI